MRKSRTSRVVASAFGIALGAFAATDALAAPPVVTSVNVVGSPLDEPGGTAGVTFAFTDTDVAQGYVATIYWGDGSAPTSMAVGQPGTFGPIPHNYVGLTPGARQVYVTVSDSGNQFGAGSGTLTVNNVAPTATLTSGPATIAESDRIAYRASLSGANVNPPVATAVTGRATVLVDLSERTIALDVVVSSLAAGENIAFTRIRMGSSYDDGRLILSVAGGAKVLSPTMQAVYAVVHVDGDTCDDCSQSSWRIEVETSTGTIIAGPLTAAVTVQSTAVVGTNEVPQFEYSVSGAGTLALDAATNRFGYILEVKGMPSTDVSGVTLQRAAAGVNGPNVVDLLAAGRLIPTPDGFHLVVQDAAFPPGDVSNLLAGLLYVNVRTAAHPAGAIRGQLDVVHTHFVVATITDPGVGQTFTGSIDWGDETAPETFTTTATTFSAAHLYRDDKSPLSPSPAKTVTFSVADGRGGAFATTSSVTVTNTPPAIASVVPGIVSEHFLQFTVVDRGGDPITAVVLDDPVFEGQPEQIPWFSVAPGVIGVDLGRVLTEPGDHLVRITVDDGDGGTASLDHVVQVQTISFDAVPRRREPSQIETALLTVRLSQPSASEVSVDYTTFDGSARAGADYEAASGRLVFPPGEVAATIGVTTYPDNLNEPNENFGVVLSDPSGGYALGTRFAASVVSCDHLDDGVYCDLGISKFGAKKPIGLKRFGTDGKKQTLTLKGKPGTTLKSTVTVVNSGPYAESITLVGSPSVSGFDVKYFDPQNGGADITASITDPDPAKPPTFVDVNRRDRRRVNVEVRISADAVRRTSTSLLITAARGDPYVEDVIREDIVVK